LGSALFPARYASNKNKIGGAFPLSPEKGGQQMPSYIYSSAEILMFRDRFSELKDTALKISLETAGFHARSLVASLVGG